MVVLRGGDYFLRKPFTVSSRSDGGRILIRSHDGERARLIGGIEIPASSLVPVSGGHHLLAAELRPLGVNDSTQLGGGVLSLKAELFEEDETATTFRPMQLARSPDVLPDGLWRWAGYENVPASATDGSWFVLSTRRPGDVRRRAQSGRPASE